MPCLTKAQFKTASRYARSEDERWGYANQVLIDAIKGDYIELDKLMEIASENNFHRYFEPPTLNTDHKGNTVVFQSGKLEEEDVRWYVYTHGDGSVEFEINRAQGTVLTGTIVPDRSITVVRDPEMGALATSQHYRRAMKLGEIYNVGWDGDYPTNYDHKVRDVENVYESDGNLSILVPPIGEIYVWAANSDELRFFSRKHMLSSFFCTVVWRFNEKRDAIVATVKTTGAYDEYGVVAFWTNETVKRVFAAVFGLSIYRYEEMKILDAFIMEQIRLELSA